MAATEDPRLRADARYKRIPKRTLRGIQLYEDTGTIQGDFLEAVLLNDLSGAVANADPENFAALQEIMLFMNNRFKPVDEWGSWEAIERHRGRVRGK